jgi:hypothetical protein
MGESRPHETATITYTDDRTLPAADQDAVRAGEVAAALIKRCRTMLTERLRYITK